MRPLFFGPPDAQLFGAYYPAASRRDAQAVVLCPPAPQQYMLTHWAHRRLAAILAGAGAHVLRFDYFGVGDSAGGSEAGTLEIWEKNIHTAQEALLELSGAQRTSFVGYGVGAVLAWRASRSAADRPRDLVLWDPVVRGQGYIRDLCAAEGAFASRLLYFPKLERPPAELAGHPVPRALRIATEAIDLVAEPLPAATRVHLYVGRETPDVRALAARLRGELRRFSFELVPEEGSRGSGALLSHRILQVIGAALTPDAA